MVCVCCGSVVGAGSPAMISKSRMFPELEVGGLVVLVVAGRAPTLVFFSPGLDNFPAAFSKGFLVSTYISGFFSSF